jgi:5-formyltetrahydrofolate cyclo-ligase
VDSGASSGSVLISADGRGQTTHSPLPRSAANPTCPVTNGNLSPVGSVTKDVLRASRRDLRAARRRLSPQEQRDHTIALTRTLGCAPAFLNARRVAAYWPADGELDPRPLLESAIGRGRRGFLPMLRPGKRRQLWFLRYRPGEPMRANRFGIPEPVRRQRRLALAWTLDLILVPLVGFDADCNRLGMGGGFYDRTLSFLHHRAHWHRPRLIGIAHECQRIERVQPQPWDIPLDAVATERQVYRRSSGIR